MLLYIELVFALTLLTAGVFLQVLSAIVPLDWLEYGWRDELPGFVAASVAVFAVYRRWDWRIRLLLFGICIMIRNAFLLG